MTSVTVRHPAHKAILKLLWIQTSKDPVEGIVRRDAVGEFQKGLEPFDLRFPKIFAMSSQLSAPAIMAQMAMTRMFINLCSLVRSTPRIGQVAKVLLDGRQYFVFHGFYLRWCDLK